MLDRLRQGGYWLVRGKINLIDRAFTSCRIESFADLGAVWGVEGAYTFRALDKYPVKEAVLVDGRITPTVAARANSYPQLRVIEGNFGDQEIADKVGNVDALFLFDVLLHQVSPDWDTILDMYAKNVRCLLIYNQQWIGSTTTVRLLDLGEKHYFRNVPHSNLTRLIEISFKNSIKSTRIMTSRGAIYQTSGNGVSPTLISNQKLLNSVSSCSTRRIAADLAGCLIFRIGPFFLRDNKVTVNPRFVRCGAGRAKSTSSEWISSEWTGHRLRVASPSNRPVLLHRTLKVPHGGCGCRRGVTVR